MTQIYSNGAIVEDLAGEVLAVTNGEVSVTLNDVDAGDFVNEFTIDEVLNQYEFSDVFDWCAKRMEENNED